MRLFHLVVTVLLVSQNSCHKNDHDHDDSVTMSAQLMCDNYCDFYYNGDQIYKDESGSRAVIEFEFDIDNVKGTHTFAMWLADSHFDSNAGLREFNSPEFLMGQMMPNGEPVMLQWCDGDGGFRGVFAPVDEDEQCMPTVVSSGDWRCKVVANGPINITDCFPTWNNDATDADAPGASYPTYGGEGDTHVLYDNCIRNTEKQDVDDCKHEYYVDYDQNWINPGYNDSEWDMATLYTEADAFPKLGGGPFDVDGECNSDTQYCAYNGTWGDSEIIWSDDILHHDVVLCRYEFVVSKAVGRRTRKQSKDVCTHT